MYTYPDYLYHHGILGMHWGIRKTKPVSSIGIKSSNKKSKSNKRLDLKTAAKVGIGIVGAGLAVYGAIKFKNYVRSTNMQYQMAKG